MRPASIDALQAIRGLKKKSRSISPSVGGERNPCSKNVQLRTLGLVQRSILGQGSQRKRRIQGSDLTLRVGGQKSPACSLCWVDRQYCGAFQEGRRRRKTSSRLCPGCGML